MSNIANQILYEDNHLLALNKQVGQIVQGDKSGDMPLVDLLKEYLKARDHKPGNVYCGVIHRLDRPVSGVVLFAKTSKALSRMNQALQERTVQKTYWALTRQCPPQEQGQLRDYLVRNEQQNKTYVTAADTPGAKLAILDYRLLATSAGGYHLLEIDLHTGRHHQIRAQLAHMGCPIKGDLKYGAARSNADGGISLHARTLTIPHPVGHSPLTLTAPLPDDPIWNSFEQ